MTKSIFYLSILFTGLAISCAGSNGADGVNGLTSVDEEPPGPNCEFGGVLVRSGIDENDNDVLDGGETTDEVYLCNGADGTDGDTYLTVTSDEAAGGNCAAGGVRVDVGLDEDGSGTLEAGEIVATEYVCDGEDGAEGAQGPVGPAGPEGAAGNDGADGSNALVALVAEPAGANCAAGGTAVQSGTDLDGDNTLDAGEVTATRYVCDGEDGADGTNGADGGGAEVFTSYSGSAATANASTVTVQQISFTASGPGTAYVIGSTDAFCSSSCGAAPVDGYLSISTSSTGSASSGASSYFFLQPSVTENFTRSGVFNISSAGSQSFYLRGSASTGNSIGYYRGQMTVIFFAD